MAKGTKKTIGYLRVSTVDQDLDKNKLDILNLANEKKLGTVQWVEEKASGKTNWKNRKFSEVIDSLKPGDNILVSELSRLKLSIHKHLYPLYTTSKCQSRVNWTFLSSFHRARRLYK